MLLRPERVKDKERAVIERLKQLFPEVEAAQELALGFARVVRQRAAECLPAWLRAADGSKVKEFVGFANGIKIAGEPERSRESCVMPRTSGRVGSDNTGGGVGFLWRRE